MTRSATAKLSTSGQGIDVSGSLSAIDLTAYIDGNTPSHLPRNPLFDYIDTLIDAQRNKARAYMNAGITSSYDNNAEATRNLDSASHIGKDYRHPSQADRNRNMLAELAILDVIDTVDADDGWDITAFDDSHLAFGKRWVAYVVICAVLTARNKPAGAAAPFDPDLSLDDCTTGLWNIRDHLVDTEPVERARYVAGMLHALNRHPTVDY